MISPLRSITQTRPRQLTLPLSFQEDGGMMPIEFSELLAHHSNYRRSSSILSFISEESIGLHGDDSTRPNTPSSKKKTGQNGGIKSVHGSSREHINNGTNNMNSSSSREAGKSSASSPLTTEELGSEDVAIGTTRNRLVFNLL